MAKKTMDDMPDLSNATPGFLIDEIGSKREIKSEAETLEKFFKTALMARIEDGQTEVIGEKFTGTITQSARAVVDKDRIIAEMGEDWWNDHQKITEYVTIRTTKRG